MVQARINTCEGGVTCADSKRYYDGYTLYSTVHENDCYLIDMSGDVVHIWPTERTNLAELRPNGNILYGRELHGLEEISWSGEVQWSYKCDYHHDFSLTHDGNIVILAGMRTRVFDRPDVFDGCDDGLSFLANHFIEIEPKTLRCIWRWWAHKHIEELRSVGVTFPRPIDERSKYRTGDIFHCNTLEVLPDTQLGRRDRRFRAGNILFSYRQLDVIGVVDRDSHEIVWAWGVGELDGQHQPTLIPDQHPITGEAMPGAGHILVFDNGLYRRNYSRVLEIDPTSNRIIWSSPTDWYSWHISGSQRLPNGNTLVCDGPAGRLFEITQTGETVWEYLNPFTKSARPETPVTRPTHDDVGGTDTSRAVYRAIRYPKQFIDNILKDNQDL